MNTTNPGDFFPVYCRACHKQIPQSIQVCPHCGQAQGLAVQPPVQQAQQPGQQTARTTMPPSTQNAAVAGIQTLPCPFCATLVTAGDYYCRACGRGLVSGTRDRGSGDQVAKAYGISAFLCALLGFSPGGIILGIVAMVKGARGLGCGAIILSIIVTILSFLAIALLMHQFLANSHTNLPLRGYGL